MRRRTFVSALGAAATSSLAGCMGYSLESQDDVDEREERIEQLESTVDAQQETITAKDSKLDGRQQTIDDLNEDIDRKNQRIVSLESDVESKDSRISTLQSDVERLEREKVAVLYAAGYDRFEDANGTFDTARDNESSGNYDIAEANYALAYGKYGSAKSVVDRAASLANDVGAADAQSVIDTSVSALAAFESASFDYTNECLYRARGSTSTADQFEGDADDHYRSAQSTTVATPASVKAELGL